jgi:hypothetical protein
VYKREREREREERERENKVSYYFFWKKSELPPKNKTKKCPLAGHRAGVLCYLVSRVHI